MLDLNSDQWINVQNSFPNADAIKVYGHNRYWTMSVFKVGPFKMAYPDFISGNEKIDEEYINCTISEAKKLGVDVIRFQGKFVPIQKETKKILSQGTIKIEDLNFWRKNQKEKAKRTRNRKSKSRISIRKGTADDGLAIYTMYNNTIKRNNGSLRYTQAYFTALSPEAAWIATIDDKPCAFVCVGFQETRGVYLHGGHEAWAKQDHPSDLLYLFMLDMAFEKNLSSFDFLPSPKSQPNLMQYKKSWGGVNSSFEVSDVVLTVFKGNFLIFSITIMNLLTAAKKYIYSKIKP